MAAPAISKEVCAKLVLSAGRPLQGTKVVIPPLGLGVYRIDPGETTYATVRSALSLGYRFIDTATFYHNEADVGRAVRESGIPREDIFITTKIWGDDHGLEAVQKAGRACLERLNIGYIDLLLMHSPSSLIVETWDGMQKLMEDGVTKAVGVSNFGVAHLEALKEHKRPVPCLNQFELHPLNYAERKDVVEYCQKNGIMVQAYGSVLSGQTQHLTNPLLVKMAEDHKATVAQVLIAWALQKGWCTIPKSTKAERLAENAESLGVTLSKEAAAALDVFVPGSLGEYWNPLVKEVDVGKV